MILPIGRGMTNDAAIKQAQAFSLVEILLVMVLLVVLASLTLPDFQKVRQKTLLKNAAQDIAYLLHAAQSRALVQHTELRVVFDGERSFGIEEKNISGKTRLAGALGRKIVVPAHLTVSTKGLPGFFFPGGDVSLFEISVCDQGGCFLVSTRERFAQVTLSEWRRHEQ